MKGIPGDRQGNTFAAFDLAKNPGMKPAYERCLAVAEGREWCALLAGPYGTGKTHLAEAAIIATGYRGMFWKVPDFLRWIRAQVFDHGWPEDRIVGPYRDAPGLVVFDDLGTQKDSEWATEQLYLVLDSRCDQRLPTIITTNSPTEKLDGRIFSRYQTGLVVCKGRDVRAVSA